MGKATRLTTREAVRIDRDRLLRLHLDLGPTRADRLIGRMLEEIALRLARIAEARRCGDRAAMLRSAGALAEAADRIGLSALARVARDLRVAADRGDAHAAAAVAARLDRLGEASLTAVWDAHDITL